MATKKSGANATLSTDDEWRIEDDLRTLARAAEIRADPKRMKAAQSLAQKKMLEFASVATDADAD